MYWTTGERLGIGQRKQSISKQHDDSRAKANPESHHPLRRKENDSPKQFMAAKKPKTDVERVACLAYFLTHERETARFKTKDITILNTEAALPKLSNPSSAVRNATNQNCYLAAAEKGNKQITTIGEAIVEALPDREAVDAAIKSHQKPKKRKKRTSKRATVGKPKARKSTKK